MTSLELRYVALTDTGLRRSTNQDSGYASSRLIAIADGMGGAAAGDLASAETMNIIRRLDADADDLEADTGSDPEADTDTDALEALGAVVRQANERLGELVADDPAVEGMGTTLEAMLWDGRRFATAHIGDSRAYLLRDGELTQISTDHTFVQSLVDEGKLTRAEARSHPHRSLLLRVMLGRDDNEPDLAHVEGRLGDRFLLCSDGLTDMVEDAVIASTLGSETIDVAATELVRLALEAGGYDNVTVVIGELAEADDEPDEQLSSSNGQPQLVGAAATGPRPRTGHSAGQAGADQAGADQAGPGQVEQPGEDLDPEELRYAPRPLTRWRWVRRVALLVVVAAIVGIAGAVGYHWSQDQYFVASHEGRVTIFRGVQADLPGVTLKHVESISDVEVDSLPTFRRQQVRAGIEASSRADAETIVKDLGQFTPSPSPTPAPTPSSTASPDNAARAPVVTR